MRRFEIATDPDVLRLARSEEWRCALAIVEYPKMTHWVRNLDFDPVYGFWLPVASSQRPLPEARSRKPFLSGLRLPNDPWPSGWWPKYKGEQLRNIAGLCIKDAAVDAVSILRNLNVVLVFNTTTGERPVSAA